MGEPVLGERAQTVAGWGYHYRWRLAFGVVIALQLLTLWAAFRANDRADDAAYWASAAETEARYARGSADEAARAARDAVREIQSLQ